MWRVAAVAGVVTSLGLVACGNETGGGTPAGNAGPTPSATLGTTPGATPERSVPEPVKTPTMAPAPTTKPVVAARLRTSMLLTGPEVATADPGRGWVVTKASADPICGSLSTRGTGVRGSLNRTFTTGLDASGGQWLTRYDDARAAAAAYGRIVATIKSCTALDPVPTHARKLTENRTLPLGDATAIVRWYDYPLPSDPGSEPGGFPYAVTRKGNVVSVLAFREMGDGVRPANFEKLARAAAGRLG